MVLTVLLIWLAALGGVTVLAGLCRVYLLLESKRSSDKHYDERQQTAHGKAYRIGFYFGIIYYLTLFVLHSLNITQEYVSTLLFAGIILQLLVAYIYMFFTGADMPFSKKIPFFFAIFFILAFLLLFSALNRVRKEILWLGTSTIPWTDIIVSVSLFSIGILQLISWIKDYLDEES